MARSSFRRSSAALGALLLGSILLLNSGEALALDPGAIVPSTPAAPASVDPGPAPAANPRSVRTLFHLGSAAERQSRATVDGSIILRQSWTKNASPFPRSIGVSVEVQLPASSAAVAPVSPR